MTDIAALDVSYEAKFTLIGFEHSFTIFESTTAFVRKYYKELGVKKLICASISPDGTKICMGVEYPNCGHDGEETRREVLVWNSFYDSMEAELRFESPIKSVLIRQRFVVAVLSDSVCVYDLTTKDIVFEQVTSENASGACDLSFDEEYPLLAICGLVPGSIQVSRIGKDSRPVFIQAHLHAISHICLNKQGTAVATSSDRGTIARVFDCLSGNAVNLFRRGSLPSDMTCIAFSPDSQWLIALSSKGTVHLFDHQHRCTEEAKAPRSISKLHIEPAPIARIAFNTPKTFVVLTSQGVCYNISLASKKLTLTSTTLVISH